MISIGIDPGLTGAIALICSRRGLLDVEDIPTCANGVATGSMKRWVDVDELSAMLGKLGSRHDLVHEQVHAFLERPIPMPRLPAQTVASQFDTFGVMRTMLRRFRQHVINPKDWKGIYGLAADKNAARACALRLYSNAPVGRVKDHNRAEAVLIAHYGLREIAG